MSGGIDSTVSAMLLQEQGYEVVGVTFRTFDSIKESCLAREKGCCSVESIMEAKHNAQRMGIEHRIVDFRDTFRQCGAFQFFSRQRVKLACCDSLVLFHIPAYASPIVILFSTQLSSLCRDVRSSTIIPSWYVAAGRSFCPKPP